MERSNRLSHRLLFPQALIESTKAFFAVQLGVDPSLIDVVIVEDGAQRRVLLRDILESPGRLNLNVAIPVPDSETADIASRQVLETDESVISLFMAEEGVTIGSVIKGEVTIVNITISPPGEPGPPTTSAPVESEVTKKEKDSVSIIGAAIGGAAGSALLAGVVVVIVIIRKRRRRSTVVDTQAAQVKRSPCEMPSVCRVASLAVHDLHDWCRLS